MWLIEKWGQVATGLEAGKSLRRSNIISALKLILPMYIHTHSQTFGLSHQPTPTPPYTHTHSYLHTTYLFSPSPLPLQHSQVVISLGMVIVGSQSKLEALVGHACVS